jgi:hypothetical protein
MSLLSLVNLGIQLLQWLLRSANEKKLLDEGARRQIAASLIATTEMVADAHAIEDWVARQPDDVVAGILRRYYTRPADGRDA